MKKRICCITIALCTVFCILFTAGCGKATKPNAVALPEVRNNGTAIQWKYSNCKTGNNSRKSNNNSNECSNNELQPKISNIYSNSK